MRIGPLVFITGLGLLCAGVVSTRADAWDTQVPARTIHLDLAGIDTLDMRDSQIRKVEIASGNTAELLYPGGKRYRWENDDAPVAAPSCHATGRVLRCTSGARFMPGEPKLYLPPGSYRLLLDDAEVEAKSGASAVALEVHGSVGWKGAVDVLEIMLVVPSATKGESHCGTQQFTYSKGRVRHLRVQAEGGRLEFGDLSDVGGIDVQAAPDVGVNVARAADLARIKVVPLTGKTVVSDWKCRRDREIAAAMIE